MVVVDWVVGCECVVELEVVFVWDCVCVVGEGGCVFVGGDDEIWVVGVVVYYVGWWYDCVVGEVVG